MLREMPSRRTAARRRTIRRRRAVALAVPIAAVIVVATAIGRRDEGSRAGAARSARTGVLGAHARRAPGAHRHGAARTGTNTNLRPGSNPSVLPGPVLIADRDNNRLLEVSPDGRVLWRFPAPGDLAPRSDVPAARRCLLLARWTQGGGDAGGRLRDQRDRPGERAHRLPLRPSRAARLRTGLRPQSRRCDADAAGDLLSADIKNCRVLVIRPPAHRPLRQLGVTGVCGHDLGRVLRQSQRRISDGRRRHGCHRDQRRLARCDRPTAGRCSPPTRPGSATRRIPTRSAPGCSCRSTTPNPGRSRRSRATGGCDGAINPPARRHSTALAGVAAAEWGHPRQR